jgi:CRISPR-associated protein Cst2
MFISDYSKQSRLLTDFAPDVLVGSAQERYSHRLQKAFELDEDGFLNVEKFKAIVSEVKVYSEVFIGIIPGVIKNEEKLIAALNELNLEKLTPAAVIKAITAKV